MRRRNLLGAAAAGACSAPLGWARAATAAPSVVIAWNGALKGAIAATATQATIAARAISMVYEAVYNAWAAYDPKASFTLASQSRRPAAERLDTWKGIAISQAAFTVLSDLFPTQQARFDALLAAQVQAAAAQQAAGQAAVATGRGAGQALLQARAYDGSNQYGNLAPGAYADWTGYVPVNTPDLLIDPERWQPLRLPTASGGTVVQKYLTPHWGLVRPFALPSGSAFRPVKPTLVTPQADMDLVLQYSAQLDDTTKAAVHRWAANPGTVSPPGQWTEIAESISACDANALDDDVKLFFAVGQAVLDASIAAWDCKRFYDSARPVSLIHYYYRNQTVTAWGGPGLGAVQMLGQNWRTYQRPTIVSPPFPEFVSGHSTFSQASATVISGLRGADTVPISLFVAAGEIAFDIDEPPVPTYLDYRTLSEASYGAGLSRIYGGIHFKPANVGGRNLGRDVGNAVLTRVRNLFVGK